MKRLVSILCLCASASLFAAEELDLDAPVEDELAEIAPKADESKEVFLALQDARAKAAPRDKYLPPPEDAQLFLPEDKKSWKLPAKVKWTPSKPGLHFVWVHFTDRNRWRKCDPKGSGALVFDLEQDGRKIGQTDIQQATSPLTTPKGRDTYGLSECGIGTQADVWQMCGFRTTAPGEVTLSFRNDRAGYTVKALVITDDPSYEPRLADFYPMYIRIRTLPAQKKPLRCDLFMFHMYAESCRHKFPEPLAPEGKGDTGWFCCSRFLNGGKRSIRITMDDGAKDVSETFFSVEISRTPDEAGVYMRCEQKGAGNVMNLAFENTLRESVTAKIGVKTDVDFSLRSLRLAKACDGQRGRLPRRFPFALCTVQSPSAVGYEVFVNEMETALLLGCRAPHTFNLPKGTKDPKLLDIASRMMLKEWNKLPSPYGYFPACYGNDCLCSPDPKRIGSGDYGDPNAAGITWYWDEPGGGVVYDCPKCAVHYREFLKENGVKPADLGVKTYDDLFPIAVADPAAQEKEFLRKREKQGFRNERAPKSDDKLELADEGDELAGQLLKEESKKGLLDPKKAAERYYWSMRFLTTRLQNCFSIGTRRILERNPKVLSTATLAPDYIDKDNSLSAMTDWFHFFENDALTLAQTEDWCFEAGDYRVVGFLIDFLRGASRRKNRMVSVYDVLSLCTAWETTAKAYAEIGHGARYVDFFFYGPEYIAADYAASGNDLVYGAIKRVTWPVGACEDTILDGERPLGDLAYVYSVESDYYQRFKSIGMFKTGKERCWDDVLLTACGYHLDVIDGNGVKDFLKGYRFAFTSEFNLRRDSLASLVDWVKGGGTLFLTAGALQYDEFNRPLGFDAAVGISREPFDYHLCKVDEKFEGWTTAKGCQTASGGTVLAKFDSGNAAAREWACGKGRIVLFSFVPGMSYKLSGWNAMLEAKKTGTLRHSGWETQKPYPEAFRKLVGGTLETCGVKRSVFTDNHDVEAHLVKGKDAWVVVLANWYGDPVAEVKVTVPDGAVFGKAESFNSEVAGVKKNADGSVTVTLHELLAGDCLHLTK